MESLAELEAAMAEHAALSDKRQRRLVGGVLVWGTIRGGTWQPDSAEVAADMAAEQEELLKASVNV